MDYKLLWKIERETTEVLQEMLTEEMRETKKLSAKVKNLSAIIAEYEHRLDESMRYRQAKAKKAKKEKTYGEVYYG